MQSLEDKTLPPQHPEGNLEVSIRTLASDLDMLQKSGGVIAAGNRGASVVIGSAGALKTEDAPTAPSGKGSLYLVWGIVSIVGTIILFLIGYYLVPKVLNSLSGDTSETTQGSVATTTAQLPTKTSNSGVTTQSAPTGEHTSLLRSTTPTIAIDLYARGIPPDRTFFVQQLSSRIAASDGNFFEILPRGINQESIQWQELADLFGANGVDATFLEKHFSSDYTMVAFDSGKAIYPAFIFKLKQGETPLLLQKDSLALENHPGTFGSFFVTNPGTAASEFKDAQVSGQPVRALSFSGSSEKFIYGWFFNSYLIMSTSEGGIKGIIEHL